MGQLIKLEDYVSRYAQNIYHYPSRFVTLKKQQWEKTKDNWENIENDLTSINFWEEEEKIPFFHKLKDLLKKSKKEQLEENRTFIDNTEEDTAPFQFTPQFPDRPLTEEDLKIQFLDQLFRFQLKWATSTISEKSFMNTQYFYDEKLKFFAQRFPDNFLIIYRPIFLVKNAQTEAEIILISPTDTWCISFIEEEENAVFQGANEHFWTKKVQQEERRVLNPLLSLNRTAAIIKNIYQLNDIELPIQKVVLSRNGYIDFPDAPLDVRFIEKRNFEEWFEAMRSLRSPIKRIQLKSAQTLLQYCQTTSYRRSEWDSFEEDVERTRE